MIEEVERYNNRRTNSIAVVDLREDKGYGRNSKFLMPPFPFPGKKSIQQF